jgi:hypothetical protein
VTKGEQRREAAPEGHAIRGGEDAGLRAQALGHGARGMLHAVRRVAAHEHQAEIGAAEGAHVAAQCGGLSRVGEQRGDVWLEAELGRDEPRRDERHEHDQERPGAREGPACALAHGLFGDAHTAGALIGASSAQRNAPANAGSAARVPLTRAACAAAMPGSRATVQSDCA